MFRQFGAGPDEISLYNSNAQLQAYLKTQGIKNKADFARLSDDEQAQKIEDFNIASGKTQKDLLKAQEFKQERDAFLSPEVTEDYDYDKVGQALMSCKTVNQCQKFDSDDIRYELERRGFTNGGNSKYQLKAIDDLSPGERAEIGTGRRWNANGEPDRNGQYYRFPYDFWNRTTKPDLIKILLGHNKKLAKMSRLREKFASSTKGARGAFPSESTNPHMYDSKTGLLKQKHLTVDHHGLTAFDIKGDRWRVHWHPFNGPNSVGYAEWKRDVTQVPLGTQKLSGVFELDSRGLPKIDQLNYIDHIGKVHQDKKDNFWQVQIVRKKNAKNKKSQAPEFAAKNRDGSIKLQWGKYDPKLNMDSKVDMPKKKFATPLGLYTYDQLMKMPLDNILKMMIVLELADESPANAKKMMKYGVGPFDPTAMHKGRLSGRQQQNMVKGKRKTTSSLPMEKKILEEKKLFEDMPNCEYPEPPNRCYSDSYIPGTCVPDEKMCFDSRLRNKYVDYVQRKYPKKAGELISKSAGDHEYVTKKDLREVYANIADSANDSEITSGSVSGPEGLMEAIRAQNN